MDETIGYINFASAEDVALHALKFARDPASHAKLIQLVYELMKQPEPGKAAVEQLLGR
ncbi:MAG: hypothetical protein PHX38_14280 [Sulfuricella sp.]|nr:hypothetical protein [Sulfuricella sp.]